MFKEFLTLHLSYPRPRLFMVDQNVQASLFILLSPFFWRQKEVSIFLKSHKDFKNHFYK